MVAFLGHAQTLFIKILGTVYEGHILAFAQAKAHMGHHLGHEECSSHSLAGDVADNKGYAAVVQS